MRSELMPIQSGCKLSKHCDHCGAMAYRSKTNLKRHEISQLVSRAKRSITKKVALPCNSIENEFFFELKDKLLESDISIGMIFEYTYWQILNERARNQDLECAIVFTDRKDVLQIPGLLRTGRKFYFAITKKNWDSSGWAELPEEVVQNLSFFFVPSAGSTEHVFSAIETFEVALTLQSINPKLKFDIPFGYDVCDKRNPDHLKWQLKYKIKMESKSLLSTQLPTKSKSDGKLRVDPKISILIPSHNRSSFLKKVLNSILEQDLEPSQFEVIIIDDGSSDGTDRMVGSIIQEQFSVMPDLNIQYLFVPRDIQIQSGYVGNRVGPIRNLGVSQSKGKILLFLDSDILLPSNYLTAILKLHEKYDVITPRRIYLSKNASYRTSGKNLNFHNQDEMIINWQEYLKDFYSNQVPWAKEAMPWKYFMTYSLSMNRDLFYRVGGFRSNFISYGYEDLDLGYRIVKCNPGLKFLDMNVFHLYHFDDPKSEYTLSENFRSYQLAMTSRMFIYQNGPFESTYLKSMAKLKGLRHRFYYQYYKAQWACHRLFRGVTHAN